MIKILRGAGVVLLFVFFGLGALFIRYCIFPFQKTKMQNYNTLQKSWKFFVQILLALRIIKLNIDDKEKISSIKNSIIVSTHPSFIDIVILMSIIPYSTCFVANKLANNPFFKGMVNLLFILETDSVEKWLESAKEKLQSGLNVIIFPMGTRHKKDETPKIRRGTALIAHETNKNIVMLKLETDFDFLQINRPIYEAGNKPVSYTLKYLGEIDTKLYCEKFCDEVSFKTELTKQISASLYKK